ncbi:hypothetical protein SMKI_08G0790 [Saccharomyces mikatae IFO 1815]|uniref:Protein transport protein SEC23 n=1 Tax=Saccharomyces mikatae IFO 1815 TaxID=226126 RepID=A0AA35IYT2_SACMI|nr:uncharacterized protein SMKI_08G0790 [Saccharomyces mikatae IFO 1815]CAI4039414.1 hypothetical protein SMKI_08G0790 [Saccharomyces mikatae IFO 1815]
MTSPITFLYEPFSGNAVTQTYDADLKCPKCGAFYTINCPLREQNIWSCLFCNRLNRKARPSLVSSNTYTLSFVKQKTFERRTIIIIDTICGSHELDHLVSTLCNSSITNEQELLSLVSIHQSGHVILHNGASPKHNAVFSIDEFMTRYNLDKLNTSYFEKKMKEGKQELYWFNGSAHRSLKKLIKEICTTAGKAKISSKRGKRCTGLALLVSSILASHCNFSGYCHIVSFLSGPCTKGGGKVVPRKRGENIRQNHHFESENPQLQLSKSSRKFYWRMFEKFGKQNLIYEFFIGSLDQIGILEMDPLINSSMAISQFDSFDDERFERSFQKYLGLRNYNAVYNCQSKVITAKKTFIVNDILKYSLNPKYLSLPVELSLDRTSTEVPMQFQTTYENQSEKYVRIETLLLPMANNSFWIQNEIAFSMKRMASHIIHRFTYSSKHANDLMKESFILSNQIREINIDRAKLIEWYYYVYKSPILSVRNTSPDERYFFLHQIVNTNKDTCLSLCKPFLWCYNGIKHDWIVSDIPLTRSQVLKDDETTFCIDGGSYFILRMGKLFQKEGRDFCCKLLNDLQRFPQPLYIETKIGASQDRFLKSKIIPLDANDKKLLGTEDMSFQEFFNLVTESNRGR